MPCFLLFWVLVVGHIGGAFRSGSGIPPKNNVSPIVFSASLLRPHKRSKRSKEKRRGSLWSVWFSGVFLRAFFAPLLHSVFCGKLFGMFQIGVDVFVAAARNRQYNDVRGLEFQAVERSQSVCRLQGR